ncbi:MAG: phosphatase PAP2 family protein [Pseudomonadota bacterium]
MKAYPPPKPNLRSAPLGVRLVAFAEQKPILASLLVIVAASLFFWAFPGADHGATGLFYTRETWFPGRTDPALGLVRDFGIDLKRGITVWLALMVGLRIVCWQGPAVLAGRTLAFLLSSAFLGPALLVNIVLKDFWGRPRPHMVEDYGGQSPYIPVWEISDHCDNNCSFVSGEASSSMWLMAFLFIVPREMRSFLFVVLAILIAFLSLNRVAFGGHFLSDVVIAWCLTLFVILLMRALVLERTEPGHDPYDAFLTKVGRYLTGLIERIR